MFQGILRAAIAVLLVLIAVLVYIDFFRSPDASQADGSEVAAAPEVPKVPLTISGFDSPAAPPEIPAQAAPPIAPQPDRAESERPASRARLPKAEIIDNGPLAEVVELPPLIRQRSTSAPIAADNDQPPAPKVSGKRTHVVQPGESLWVISRKYLGAGDLNAKIAECNGLASKDKIRVGQVLVIPDLNEPTETVSEDLADHEDTRRILTVSRPSNGRAAAMNASVKNRF